MTEEQLIAAIDAAPEDDGPRLVLADWLLERRDPRGELIQVQCALARGDGPRAELEARERHLYAGCMTAWCGVPRVAYELVLRRGLPEEIVLIGMERAAAVDELLARLPIRTVSVRHVNALPVLRDLTRLERVRTLAGCLELGGTQRWRDLAIIRRAGNGALGVTDDALAQLAAATHLRLEALELADSPLIGPEGVAPLVASPVASGLRLLDLALDHFRDDARPRVHDPICRVLARASLDALERLVLRGRPIRRRGARFLAAGRFPALRHLDLRDCELGDESLALVRSRFGATPELLI